MMCTVYMYTYIYMYVCVGLSTKYNISCCWFLALHMYVHVYTCVVSIIHKHAINGVYMYKYTTHP